MSEGAEREHWNQYVVTEAFVCVRNQIGQQPDLRDLSGSGTLEHMRVHVADRRVFKLHIAAFDGKALDPIERIPSHRNHHCTIPSHHDLPSSIRRKSSRTSQRTAAKTNAPTPAHNGTYEWEA